MEIGDLIYIILLLLFMILGFFNDSRKKKEQQNQQQKPNPKTDFQPEDREITQSPPPFLTEDQVKRFEFQKERKVKQGDSKMVPILYDLATDFKKESLGSSIFRNEAIRYMNRLRIFQVYMIPILKWKLYRVNR